VKRRDFLADASTVARCRRESRVDREAEPSVALCVQRRGRTVKENNWDEPGNPLATVKAQMPEVCGLFCASFVAAYWFLSRSNDNVVEVVV
jgi:hypothetical protein